MIPTHVPAQIPGVLSEGYYLSEVTTPRRMPVLTFLPTGYEPEYSYPLLVFLHGRGSTEKQVVRWAPKLSRRNYIAIALRGPEVIRQRDRQKQGYSWGSASMPNAFAEEYLFQAIELTQQHVNIHPRRIFLVGFGEGCELAYRLGLGYPDRFAGIVALNGSMPQHGGPLLRYPDVRGLPVMIGHGIANVQVPLSFARSSFQLLYTAGLNVEFRTYPTTHQLHRDMLPDVDRWVMKRITT